MDFIKFMFKHRRGYILYLLMGAAAFTALKYSNLFITGEEKIYYIAVVLSFVVVISFIVGIVWLSITEYLMWRDNKKV